MTITSHKITANPLEAFGEVDIDFNYAPPWKVDKDHPEAPAELSAIKASPVRNGCLTGQVTISELKDIAQEWLDGDGYFHACAVAREQRGEPQ